MNLRNFEDTNVRLTDVAGKVYEGYATDYTFPEDNESGEESITLLHVSGYSYPIEFRASEIKSIKRI